MFLKFEGYKDRQAAWIETERIYAILGSEENNGASRIYSVSDTAPILVKGSPDEIVKRIEETKSDDKKVDFKDVESICEKLVNEAIDEVLAFLK